MRAIVVKGVYLQYSGRVDKPARKPTLHRGFRQIGGHERKGQPWSVVVSAHGRF